MFTSFTSLHQLHELLEASETTPQLIFKHSTRCPVSFGAWDSVQSQEAELAQNADLWLINVITHRPISLGIADALGVTHQSPQAIVLYRKEVVWHGSHHSVTGKGLLETIQKVAS